MEGVFQCHAAGQLVGQVHGDELRVVTGLKAMARVLVPALELVIVG